MESNASSFISSNGNDGIVNKFVYQLGRSWFKLMHPSSPWCNTKSCRTSKHVSIHSIMDHDKGFVECYIHDSDIEKRNRIILAKAKEMVVDCHNLGISFHENDDEVALSTIKIISKDD